MKATLLNLFLLFCFFNLAAQQEVNTSFATQMTSTFANLEKNRVPYGLLSDFSMEFTTLPAFQGSLNDSSYVHPGTLKQLYKTLLFSRVTTSTQGFVPYSNFETNWESARKKKTIVLSGLFYRYSKFFDNAHPDKITISNNKIYDKYVNGVWQNPYQEQKAFAISPSTIHYKSLEMLVKFPANLWYSNMGSQVQSIQINFNDGKGYQALSPGQEKYIQYNTAGVKTWVYKLSLSTGEILYSHSKINVETGISSRHYGSKTSHTGDGLGVDTLNIRATKSYLGKFGKATVLVNYGNTVGEIRRPLIMVEGLDMGAITSPEEPYGESDIEDFMINAFNSLSNDLRRVITGSENLNDNDQEYDIIYVNWSNGTDYLQRNAYVLQEVIKWVNNEKANVGSTTPNVVLGQSMGGVIARYALRDMENRNLPHDTRTYISHDAPHLGANVPLGYQFAARHGRSQYVQSPFQLLGGDVILPLFNDGVGVSDYLGLLDQPAAKQLVGQRVDANYSLDNNTHLQWQTELKNMGYPQLTERNVAIANGNQCAITQGFSPGNNLLSINGTAKTGWLTDVLTSFTGYGSYANTAIFLAASVFTIEPGFLFGLLPGNSKLTAAINIKALPAYGQTAQIYSGKLTFTKKLLFLININVNLTDRSFNSPSNTLPYDYFPGGVEHTGIASSTANQSNAFYGMKMTITSDPDFSFIPTASALDIGKGFTALTTADYLRRYEPGNPPSSPKDTPFDNFIASYRANPFNIAAIEVDDNTTVNITNFNQGHLDFYAGNGNWLANEIENNIADNVVDCTFLCSAITINGNSNLCSSGSYSIQTGVNVQWSASPSNLVNFSNNGSSTVTISPVSSSSRGEVTLTALISSQGCGSKTLTKKVYVGKPYATAPSVPTICINNREQTEYILPASQGATSYQLISNSSNLTINGTTNYSFTNAPTNIYFRSLVAGNYTVTIKTTNSCGTTTGYISVKAEYCTTSKLSYTVYPNPASEEVIIEDVEKRNNNSTNSQAGPNIPQHRLGKLYDFGGNLIKVIPLEAGNAITKMEVSNLKSGLYFLKIQVRDEEEIYKIIVAH